MELSSIEIIVAVVGSVLGWLINLVKNMMSSRIETLESKHECNEERIDALKDRVTHIEASYIRREDLTYILGDWKEEIKKSVDSSFERVHERIDEIKDKTNNCSKFQEIIKNEIPVANITKRPTKQH